MKEYKILSDIATGSFGKVMKAKKKDTGELVAIKQMKDPFENFKQCTELREVKSLMKLKHQNIIKMKEVQLVKKTLYLVFQYMKNNIYLHQKNRIQKNCPLKENEIRSIIF